MHPADSEVYPVGSVVRLKATNEFAKIVKVVFLKDGKNFLHYLGPIQDRKPGNYVLYHHELEVEHLPPTSVS